MSRHSHGASLLAILLLSAAVRAGATTEIRVEGEDWVFGPYNNNGGDPIHTGYCESASQEHCADGVDKPGDWIQIYFYAPAPGDYDLFIAYQAMDDEHDYRAYVWPESGTPLDQWVDFHIVGEGAG